MKNKIDSINTKLILLISAILFGTIFVILFSTNWILIRFQKETVNQALRRTELLVNEMIASKLTELKVQSQLVGELPILNTVVENGEINTIKDVGKTYRSDLGVPIFDIMGRNGTLVASIGGNFVPDDTMVGKLSQQILEEGGFATIYPRGGKLILVGGAPIGTSEDASGVLLLGTELDSVFAGKIRNFTKSEISFFNGGRVRGSSLPSQEQARLESLFSRKIEPMLSRGRAEYLEMGAYAIRCITLKDKNSLTLGTVVILMPLSEHRKMLATLKYSLIGIALVVFIIAWGIAFLFATTFTRPIADAVHFAQKLASGDRNTPIEINRSDELGVLQESLEKMRVALKELIENLDAKVKDGIKHVTDILDNLDSGFLVFDSKGMVQPGYSRISEEYFGKNLVGKRMEEILAIDPEIWPSIESWREILFNGRLPFKDVAKLGPGSFEKLPGRYIELAYRPLYGGGKKLAGAIFIATDKTVERELFRKFELEKDRVKLILRITFSRESFMEFLKDSHDTIQALQKQMENREGIAFDIEGAFRTLHTIKGNAAMYNCTRVKEMAHELESDLAAFQSDEGAGVEEYLPNLRAGLAALQEALKLIVTDNRLLFGDISDGSEELRHLTVSAGLLSDLEKALLENFHRDSPIYRLFLETLIHESFISSLRRYDTVADDLAERRHKQIHPIIWKGESIKVRLPPYKRLIASIIHAFRNAIDHGIESPEDREAGGKDPCGHLWVKCEKRHGIEPMLLICIKDDGGGIDPTMIRLRLVNTGLLDEASALNLNDDAILQYVFKNGFSTNETITEISGRGVGLDAIACEAGKLDGRTWILSEIGKGTELFIEVPVID